MIGRFVSLQLRRWSTSGLVSVFLSSCNTNTDGHLLSNVPCNLNCHVSLACSRTSNLIMQSWLAYLLYECTYLLYLKVSKLSELSHMSPSISPTELGQLGAWSFTILTPTAIENQLLCCQLAGPNCRLYSLALTDLNRVLGRRYSTASLLQLSTMGANPSKPSESDTQHVFTR